MAAKTTAAAGDWNTPGTWTGGAKPVAGDTATINHAVDITTTEQVGTSGIAGTVALTINAALTVKPGGQLTYRGDIVVGNAPFEVQGTGILEHSASLSAAPSTTIYKIIVGSANNQANSYFVMSGSAGSRSIWRSVSGGAHTWLSDGGWTRGGKAKLQWASLLRIGDGTNHSLNFDLNSSSADMFYMDHVTCDDCAGINSVAALIDGTTFRMLNVTFKNSGSNLVTHVTSNDLRTSGERSIRGCVFDTQPQFYGINFTYGPEHNIFYQGIDVTDTWESWTNGLVRLPPSATAMASMASIKNLYVLFDDPAGVNPHFIAPDGSRPGHNLDGIIFEFTGTDEQGDCIVAPSPGSATVYGIYRCIVLPNASGLQSGTLLSCLGNANVKFIVEQNTARASNWSVGVGEGVGFAGIIQSLKNNIFHGKTGGTGFKITDTDATGVNDMVTAANADYNCGFNLAAGIEGKGYNTPMTGTPGAHDVQADPQFFDATRNISTWDASLGGPGTVAHALTELTKMNDDTGYNTSYSVGALYQYVRSGFKTQNASLTTGGSTGGPIGAAGPYVGVQRILLNDGVSFLLLNDGTSKLLTAASELPSAGPTQTPITVAGGLTPSGTLQRKTLKVLLAGATPTGAVVKKTVKSLAAGETPTGTLLSSKLSMINPVGGITPGPGTLTRSVRTSKAGGLTPSATLGKRTTKLIDAGQTLAGLLGQRVSKSVGSGLTPTASLAASRLAKLSPVGSVTPAATVTRQAAKSMTGGNTPAGALLRRVVKALTGGLTPAGVLTSIKLKAVSLVGSMTQSATTQLRTNKSLTAAWQPGAILVRRLSKALSGGSTPAGTTAVLKVILRSFTGTQGSSSVLTKSPTKVLSASQTPTGALTQRLTLSKALAGALTPVGALLRRIGKAVTGGLTPAGTVASIKVKLQPVTGGLTPVGAVARQERKVVVGAIAPAAAITRRVTKTATGGLTPAGTVAVSRLFMWALTGTITTAASLVKQVKKTLVANLTPAGILQKLLRRSLIATLLPTGLSEQGARLLFVTVGATMTPAATIKKVARLTLAGVLLPGGGLGSTATHVAVLYFSATILPAVTLTAELKRIMAMQAELNGG